MTTIASTAPRRGYDLASPRLARASSPRGRRLSAGRASAGKVQRSSCSSVQCTVPFAGPSWLSSTGASTSSRSEASTSLRSAPRRERSEQLRLTGSSSACPSPTLSLNHRCGSGGCSSRGDGATTNRRSSTNRGLSSSSQTERSTTSRSCRCQPVGRDSTTSSVASTTGRRSGIPLEATPDVCDRRARSTQKGRVLHRRQQCDSLER